MRISAFAIGAYFFALTLNLATPAYAYLDAGSGSMLLQLLVGGVAGVMMAVKLYWRSIIGLFSRKSNSDGEANKNDAIPDKETASPDDLR